MHLTVRMAWHDNKWNGKICCNPAGNTYCTGVHSLLSGRIEKRKDTEKEQQEGIRGEYVAMNFPPANVPPCYWSINAFGDQDIPVEHQHAFTSIEQTVPEVLRKFSVITWPFKLSFVHGEENKKLHGNYWPDLDRRIEHYIAKFKPKSSIIFFYANYDNPVSGDEMKYLVLGCSPIKNVPTPLHFPLSSDELEKWRAPKRRKIGDQWVIDDRMKNFPTMNWMLQFSHDPESAILLPYHDYLSYIEQHPNASRLLEDIKVTVDEESLVKGFKYVSMDIDDDKSLYLLYKIRKAILKVQEHGQAVVPGDQRVELDKINRLIAGVWKTRGIYPSLTAVLNYFIEDKHIASAIALAIVSNIDTGTDLNDIFCRITSQAFPAYLESFEDTLLDLAEDRQFKKYTLSLAKLSLFVLTQAQVFKIIEDKKLLNGIAENPYCLFEQYQPGEDNLDIPDMQDEPIDVFKVDMGMIPDKKFVTRHRRLQNLTEDSPQRLRSVIVNYLWLLAQSGHCYSAAEQTVKSLYEHPLIYKNGIKLDDQAIINIEDDYRDHFIEKLAIETVNQHNFIYLKIVRNAEKFLENTIDGLIARAPHGLVNINMATHINSSLQKLDHILITTEQKEKFNSERAQLYQNVFERSFFLLTGRPGAGKTYETSQIISHLVAKNEQVVILAPTGKAALRLSENIKRYTALDSIQAQTIDNYVFQQGFGDIYEDWENCFLVPEERKLVIDNLIIDESSMLDLKKLSVLFSMIRFDHQYPKRVILVGDENQLPPIGFGKPFHDLITHVKSMKELNARHYIHLISNCRQENDEQILQLAEAFAEKNKYYEASFNLIDSGEGQKSKGLFVYKWSDELILNEKILAAMDTVFHLDLPFPTPDNSNEKLNLLYGLYKTGFVNNQNFDFQNSLKLESLQLLSPYRTDFFGTLGLNKMVQKIFRYIDKREREDDLFHHGEKIIRINNWYKGYGVNRQLVLSNGSVGVVNLKFTENKHGAWVVEKKYYFKDHQYMLKWVDKEEHFDLAYAITVHKSQGSDFRNVFLVIPKRTALLNKELIYTALTRSKFRLFLFIQDSEENLLMKAKKTSQLLLRRTSVFRFPKINSGKFSPEPGVTVVSKVEFIIYQALKRSGLTFKYEHPLELSGLSYKIHPDFTIYLEDGTIVYWEHLGMLDIRNYYNDWQDRCKEFRRHGLQDQLVTTDDLKGINIVKLEKVISDIKGRHLELTLGSQFSDHHYELN
ncbi:ATP-dependent DNA helicase [Pedobacter deserti]|uniref:ATP-dependent DNA helicase n=1 Tax=Pedobacter deserti TaxID=2817382 RepID=UPI00210F16F2|nr:AAA family ATPase [Pedobacter sp. SYSU D00382]